MDLSSFFTRNKTLVFIVNLTLFQYHVLRLYQLQIYSDDVMVGTCRVSPMLQAGDRFVPFSIGCFGLLNLQDLSQVIWEERFYSHLLDGR